MKQQKTTKMIVMMGLFIGMSAAGAYIKIPNPVTSSIALDSLPAYMAALVLGGGPGAAVGFLGHMLSAALGGFPLSLPIHLLIAVEMSVIMFVFSFIAKKFNLVISVIIGILLNGIVSPAVLIFIPGMGLPAFLGSLIPLTAASVLNIIVAAVVYYSIRNSSIVKNIGDAENGL